MRRIIHALLLPMAINAYAQDAIIYRDGRVKEVKIIQTNNDKTLFKEAGNKHAAEEYVDNKQVFMLKFKTRGNVVFNANGERILTTSERIQIPKDAIVVYYKDGREVPAYNLTMDANVVSFKPNKKAKYRPIYSAKSEVFMIRYPDGTRDILTNLAVEEQRQREREAEEARLKAQREAVVADSIKQATVEAAASATNPKKATIITKKGMRMKVWVCSETDSMVSYKKTNSSKAAIFNMSKAKIKSIVY
ncbi:hypothetical protein [Leyella stercorea]|uniref:hypothetical protein n=1 Tax=Leyella stercorea TaxID=363265 RepID=UPI001A41FF8F|nr:hypothetical protein [Leyella stercorea]MBL6517233.1 hypothetical protein [Leyella stercorea]